MKKIATLLVCLLPSFIASKLLRRLGHMVAENARIGLSIIYVDYLYLNENAKVGHFNLISCDRIYLDKRAYIGRNNIMWGPFSIILKTKGAVGNGNKITRGKQGRVTSGKSFLRLGELSKITANHRLDLTRTIRFGDYSTLAGTSSEIWTHGYVHEQTGPGRYRVDGAVSIGNNVYLGSRCIITGSLSIASGCQVGAGAVVSKSITEVGFYVSQALRKLPLSDMPELRDDLKRDSRISTEIVYVKDLNNP